MARYACHKLYQNITYLAGAIEHANNQCRQWRKRFTQLVQARKLGLVILDPTNKPRILGYNDDHQEYLRLRKKQNYDEITNFMKAIIRSDLRMVDKSNFLTVFYDPKVPTVGTIHEIVIASIQRKPILLIVPGGKAECPGWLLGLVKHFEIFPSVEDCVEYLICVDNGMIQCDDRWVFI